MSRLHRVNYTPDRGPQRRVMGSSASHRSPPAADLLSDGLDGHDQQLEPASDTEDRQGGRGGDNDDRVVYYRYPRQYVTTSGMEVRYDQFRGYDAPPDILGGSGDIYIDITPGAYRIFAKYDSSWKEWMGIKKGNYREGTTTHPFFVHPRDHERGLWTNGQDIVWRWFRGNTSSGVRGERWKVFKRFGRDVVSAHMMVEMSRKLVSDIKRLSDVAPEGQSLGAAPPLQDSDIEDLNDGTAYRKHHRGYLTPEGKSVKYAQFCGRGAPPDTLGALGDIYIDVTPGAYRVFAKCRPSWKEWLGIKKNTSLQSGGTAYVCLTHPRDPERVLWTDGKNIVWQRFPSDSFRPLYSARGKLFKRFGSPVVTAHMIVEMSGALMKEIKQMNVGVRNRASGVIDHRRRSARSTPQPAISSGPSAGNQFVGGTAEAMRAALEEATERLALLREECRQHVEELEIAQQEDETWLRKMNVYIERRQEDLKKRREETKRRWLSMAAGHFPSNRSRWRLQ